MRPSPPTLVLALLSAGLLLPAPARAAEPAPAEATLLFAWPDRASARVSFTSTLRYPRSSRQSAPSQAVAGEVTVYRRDREEKLQTFRTTGTLRIDAQRRGDEVWISMRDVAATGAPPPFSPTNDRSLVPAMGEVVQVLRPDRTVARLEGTAALREARRRFDQQGGLAAGEARYDFLAALDLQRSVDLWNALLGEWAGRTLPLDVPLQAEANGRLPCADLSVPHRAGILLRRVPCGSPSSASCLEIRTRREADPAVLAAAQARKDQRDGAQAPPAPLAGGGYEGTERLVVEPGTLLPVHLTREERFDLPGPMPVAFECAVEMDFAWDRPRG